MARNYQNKTKSIGYTTYYDQNDIQPVTSVSSDTKLIGEKIRLLRWKLNQKAKSEPRFKFYSLYGLICRKDILQTAWKHVGKRGKASGVDGLKADDFLNNPTKLAELLDSILSELQSKTYRASPVLRVKIPKPDGSKRPLGIPTLKDRIVQMAVFLILEPIFEADFLECSYGFRPGKRAHDALTKIKEHVKSGRPSVYDADLKGYFDSIPHDKLIKCVKMRVTDSSVIKLIQMWLKAPIVELSDNNKHLPPKANRKGVPQGGIISPLLANIYLHWFDKKFHHSKGPAKRANARLVRYADDFVIIAPHIGPELIEWTRKTIEEWLGLQINQNKTSILNLKNGDTLDFLGFTFKYDRSVCGYKSRFLNMVPSKKSVKKARKSIKAKTGPKKCFAPAPDIIEDLNRFIRGWTNYFKFGFWKSAFSSIGYYARQRMVTHLNRRSQRKHRWKKGESRYAHLKQMGLICL